MSGAYARGACPGLTAPMVTGDGLLARLVPAAPIRLDAFIGLCAAARAHGNGTMEISARGSLQIRGLNPVSAPLFAEAVAALAIDICESVPVIADPLPGDPAALIDANAIATALSHAAAERMLPLAPKISVVVDGGGRLDLDTLFADIRLRAAATSEGPRFHVALAGDGASATPVGIIAPGEALDAALALLTAIAELGPEARGADLLRVHKVTGARSGAAPRPVPQNRAQAIGLHPLKGGAFAFGLGLAFGHAHAEALMPLAAIASRNDARWARPAPDRALLLGPLSEANATATSREAQELGFIVEARDPRRRIVACPGAPACAQGLIAARALAAEIARDVPLPGGQGVALHVSGCAKGCAHPAPAPLTIVGTEGGCGVIANGTARAAPVRYIEPRELIAALRPASRNTLEAVNA